MRHRARAKPRPGDIKYWGSMRAIPFSLFDRLRSLVHAPSSTTANRHSPVPALCSHRSYTPAHTMVYGIQENCYQNAPSNEQGIQHSWKANENESDWGETYHGLRRASIIMLVHYYSTTVPSTRMIYTRLSALRNY